MESVFADSERFERLVWTDFSFVQRYDREKQTERKYAEMILKQQMERIQRQREPNQQKLAEFFKQQITAAAEEQLKEQSQNNSQSSQSRLIRALQKNFQNQLFDMIQDDLNPYKKKRN